MNSCPVCGERAIGKVGVDQYFCWECCVEFAVNGEHMKVFHVEADGSLTQYAPPGQETVNLQM